RELLLQPDVGIGLLERTTLAAPLGMVWASIAVPSVRFPRLPGGALSLGLVEWRHGHSMTPKITGVYPQTPPTDPFQARWRLPVHTRCAVPDMQRPRAWGSNS